MPRDRSKLHSVPPAANEPPPDLSYEARERQYIASRDWAALHTAGDRRAPVFLPACVRRLWR